MAKEGEACSSVHLAGNSLAEVVLREADGHLSAPLQGTARCAQNRARLVQALYTRLDRLTEPAPATA
ncbi:hypothetical protein [Streptomyces sanglieri]|uniref:hypothetical protein n=1 Tax=Streptomyces sanglieri TaxID=193460 RepID=UPI003525690E